MISVRDRGNGVPAGTRTQLSRDNFHRAYHAAAIDLGATIGQRDGNERSAGERPKSAFIQRSGRPRGSRRR